MKWSDWGLLLKAIALAIPKAVADYKANAPRPAAAALTGAQAAAAARKVQSFLALAIPVLDGHPGAITAADDILEVLEAHGVTGASDIEGAINGASGAGAMIEKALPEIIWALGAFEAAPTGITGDSHSTMWQS